VRSKFTVLPILAAALCPFAIAQSKIAVINIQGAIVSTQDGKRAAADLEAKFAPKRKEVDARQAEINGLKAELQKGENTMSEQSKQELIRKIDSESKSLQRDMEDDQSDLQQAQQEAVQKIAQKMTVVISEYAKANGFVLVLDDSSPQTPILFASNTIDITKDIIDLYDKNSGPASAPAQPPAAKTPSGAAPIKH
jgi:outer membrane protein